MAITLGCEQIVFIYLRGYFEHILGVMEKFMIACLLSRFLFGTIAAKMLQYLLGEGGRGNDII